MCTPVQPSPLGQVKLDIHRLLPAWGGARDKVQAITAQVWAEAVTLDWDGLSVQLPQPLDRAVVSLALGRTWGGDTGGLKPADPADLRLLRTKYGLSNADLSARA